MICPAKIFVNVDTKLFCFLTSLILLPSMQMFKGGIYFVLCCVPTIIHVVLS